MLPQAGPVELELGDVEDACSQAENQYDMPGMEEILEPWPASSARVPLEQILVEVDNPVLGHLKEDVPLAMSFSIISLGTLAR